MKSSATTPEEFLAPDGRTPRLNLPADYVKTLRVLANRYGWTFGIFYAGGSLRLETARPGTRKAYMATFGPDPGNVPETAPDSPSAHFCEHPVKKRGRLVFGLCELAPISIVGDEWRCGMHGGVAPALNEKPSCAEAPEPVS